MPISLPSYILLTHTTSVFSYIYCCCFIHLIIISYAHFLTHLPYTTQVCICCFIQQTWTLYEHYEHYFICKFPYLNNLHYFGFHFYVLMNVYFHSPLLLVLWFTEVILTNKTILFFVCFEEGVATWRPAYLNFTGSLYLSACLQEEHAWCKYISLLFHPCIIMFTFNTYYTSVVV